MTTSEQSVFFKASESPYGEIATDVGETRYVTKVKENWAETTVWIGETGRRSSTARRIWPGQQAATFNLYGCRAFLRLATRQPTTNKNRVYTSADSASPSLALAAV